MVCKICLSSLSYFGRARVLSEYNVDYFRCDYCGFIQTEEPFWLEKAYSEVINDSDRGYVGRNLILAKMTKNLISLFYNRNGRFIDYGGGYGLFVRIMRDDNLDFWWYDKFCQNIFAKNFEALKRNQTYDLLTAFELFEHLISPIDEIEQMLKYSNNILFSTTLVPDRIPKLDEWWYYGLEHGQHLSFFTVKSLSIIAEKFDLHFCIGANNIGIFSKKAIWKPLFNLVTRKKMIYLIDAFRVH